MYLTKIGARALEGRSFEYDLTRANLIIGDNGAGKTAIFNAITLLLLGYKPRPDGTGKTNQATFELSSGPVLEVWGTFDSGATMRRRWTAKGDGVKAELVEIPPELEKFGAGGLAVMLDAATYFNLSDRERVEYVAANCPGEPGLTQEQVVNRLFKVAPDYAIGVHYARLDTAIKEVPDEVRTPGDQIEFLIEGASADWKSSKETVKRMEETVRGLTHLRAQDGAALRPSGAIEDDQAKNLREQGELTERKSALATRYSEMVNGRNRRAAISRELNASEKDRAEKARLDEKLALILKTIAEAGEPADLANLIAKKGEFAAAFTVETEKEERSRRARFVLEKELDALDAAKVCPFCGATGSGWKQLKAAELARKIDELKEIENVALAQMDIFSKAHKAALAVVAAEQEKGDRRRRLDAEEKAVRYSLAQVEPRLARIATLAEESARLAPEDPQLETDVQLVQTEINLKAEEGRRLNSEARSAAARSGDLQRLAQAEEQRDASKKEQDAAAAAGKELRAIQAELVEAVFKPLLETANAIFDGVPVYPRLAYRDGMIGTWRTGAWVGHRTFSGAERSLAYAAIQAALTSKAPARVMLIDELGNFRRKNATEAAGALLLAVEAGLLEQVIGIDPERPEIYLPGEKETWNLIVVE